MFYSTEITLYSILFNSNLLELFCDAYDYEDPTFITVFTAFYNLTVQKSMLQNTCTKPAFLTFFQSAHISTMLKVW